MTSPEPFDLDREPAPPSPPYDYGKAMWFVDNVLSPEIPAAIRAHVVRLKEIAALKHPNDLRHRNDNLAANNNALNARATKAEARVTALEAELKARKHIGAQFANMAYNLVQSGGLTVNTRNILDALRHQWDAIPSAAVTVSTAVSDTLTGDPACPSTAPTPKSSTPSNASSSSC